MKNYKIIYSLYFLSAFFLYLAAIICFVSDNTSMGVVWMCLGSTFLCVGSLYIKKAKDNNADEDKKH